MLKNKALAKQFEVALPKSAAVLYSDVQRVDFPTEAQYITEKDAEGDARLIAEYLERLGVAACLHAGNAELPEWLRAERPEMALNLVDSIKGKESLASAIPGVLELLELPYTGADVLGLSLDTNKFVIKKLLQQNGVPVPNFQLFNTPEDYMDPAIRFPLISKLNAVHGSVEITRDAVSETEKQLRKRLRYLIRTYKQPVLVEEFISGREITAIVIQDKKKKVFLAEKHFTRSEGKYVFLTFEDQWLSGLNEACHYTRLRGPAVEGIREEGVQHHTHGGVREIRYPPGPIGALLFHRHELQPGAGAEGTGCGAVGDFGFVWYAFRGDFAEDRAEHDARDGDEKSHRFDQGEWRSLI